MPQIIVRHLKKTQKKVKRTYRHLVHDIVVPITHVGIPDRILVIEKDSAPRLPLSVLKTVKKIFKKTASSDMKNAKNLPVFAISCLKRKIKHGLFFNF